MIKVLIISTVGLGLDGISANVMNYVRFIEKEDICINIVAPNKVEKWLKEDIKSCGAILYEIERNKNPIAYLYKLNQIIRSSKYDIVHVHGNSSTMFVEMLAALLGGVAVRIVHSHNTTTSHPLLNKVLTPFFNHSYTQAFACGVDAGRWLYGHKPFKIIPNGLEVDKYCYSEDIREKYRSDYQLTGKIVIGHIGAFIYQKNHEFIIDFFNRVNQLKQNYVLLLIGDGVFFPKIKQKVIDLGIEDKVIMVGETQKVPQLLQTMDLLVLPSRYEGMPYVAIEAQLAGLPVLVSDKVTKNIKLTDLVEFIPLQADSDGWAEKITGITCGDRIYRSKQALVDVGQAGFNIKENARELKELYNQFVYELK